MNNVKNIPSLKIDDLILSSVNRWKAKGFFIHSQNIHETFNSYPCRSDYYAIGICTSGYAKIMVNGEILNYDKNSFAILLPNTVSKVLEISKDYSAMSIYFEKDFLLTDLSLYQLEKYHSLNYKGVPRIKIANQEMDLIVEYIERLQSKMEDMGHLFRDIIIKNQIISLINELEHIYLSNYCKNLSIAPIQGKEKLLNEFKDLLRKHFKREHYTSFYANSLSITTKYLNELLKESTGKTTKAWINDALLTEAKILLRTGSFNISEVCTILEYDNLEVFSRFFKKNTGISPSKFKNGSN
ncbi:Arabinose operon regulatory protein [Chryseobacterium nakagawai]|uniref:AraC family transcriptional regulator n=1 Tax=Chryseobacterium nakagawai TaxID=1241982 RepID=A0AAD0YSW6_CHRNA|nr:AraC family transcriptional regulator [Chryseobacterium nakagawai]AZA93608.1 AraC family transcriptional regulator [Chryseobacterium nakagawai]VEH20308.1 Arabinose operon regulatory protein [Chryseobacterium nakagawai]